MMAADMLQQAVMLHQQGKLVEAEALYETVLRQAPGELNALHLLGVLRQQQGRAGEAAALLERVLAAAPDAAAVHSKLRQRAQGSGPPRRRRSQLPPGA